MWSRFALMQFKLHEIGNQEIRKIVKIVATRCHRSILKPKCTQFDFG